MAYKFPFLIHSVKCSNKYPYITEKGIKDSLVEETGRDRIIRMFSTNDFGLSPEIAHVIKTGQYTFIFAGILGALGGILKGRDDFFRRNMASSFESKHLARVELIIDKRKAFEKYQQEPNSIRRDINVLSTMTVANYRNKITCWEHAGCGAILGGLSRINYGFKGVSVAGGLGGILGLIAGSIITLAMHLGGHTLEDLRCYLHEEYYTVKIMNKPSEDKARHAFDSRLI
ncbi:uncharacterized protein TNIN_285481 [Trichonephila inaurata madagascariensis]|uniref:RPII140-upstream gene protein n=1 Tax=Trichonephila inaurata madagascariensis TaxID=2747483 RepID=A0A8X7CGA2_9ARAC|nr:uncharacterized protein TNIN_285481 [Trichonephila inaurata madagascariensis]